MISMIRRSMPNLVAFDMMGVQAMSGPTGLIFAMRSKHEDQNGDEALFDEVDSRFSSRGTDGECCTVNLLFQILTLLMIEPNYLGQTGSGMST